MYINYNELKEIVNLYYKGELDNVENYLSNLYKDLRELHPLNSLFGNITSEEFKEVLNTLEPIEERVFKAFLYQRDIKDYVYIQSTFKDYIYNDCKSLRNIRTQEDWELEIFIKAYTKIEKRLLEVL